MKKISILLVGFAFCIGCKSQAKPGNANLTTNSHELLKEYAFCTCLLHTHPDSSSLFAKDPSRGVLFEISDYPEQVLNVVDSFSKVAAARIAPSELPDHAGRKLAFFDCFKFYNSNELDSLVKSMDNKTVAYIIKVRNINPGCGVHNFNPTQTISNFSIIGIGKPTFIET